MAVYLSGAVEGPSDEAVWNRLASRVDVIVHRIQIQNGKTNLRRALPGYNAAAVRAPWLVLVDLDQEFDCSAALVADWLTAPSTFMRLRVVVRAIEAWLLADDERFSAFFAVRRTSIPGAPDNLPDPKQSLLNLVAQSKRTAVRDDMVPRPGSGRRVGAAYTSRLIEFAQSEEMGWRPEVAAKRSPSLARCLKRLNEAIDTAPEWQT